MDHERYIQVTKTWLNNFVIKHNICPFAKAEYDQNRIHYCVLDSEDETECLTSLIMECLRLDSDSEITTTLLIMPKGFEDFERYLDFLSIAEMLLVEHDYEGIYQIASFHPDYCFQDADPEDSANFTNRSPYPMLHLLRESSIESALKSMTNPESIPERNIEFTRQLGKIALQKILTDCFRTSE